MQRVNIQVRIMKKHLQIIVVLFALVAILLPAAACNRQSTLEAPTIINRQNSLVLYGVDPLTLDPAASAEMTSHEYVTQIFGGLIKLEDAIDPALFEVPKDFSEASMLSLLTFCTSSKFFISVDLSWRVPGRLGDLLA